MKFKICKIDVSNELTENKGTKEKYWLKINNKKCLVKFNMYLNGNYNEDLRSWNVSEKIFSEISRYLSFDCVETDFICDEKGRYGIASYDFRNDNTIYVSSGDDLFYSVFRRNPKKIQQNISKDDYTYNNIIKILLHYDEEGNLLKKFNSIMVMDALFGEGDRHYENWGIYKNKSNKYELLPMYDNSSCLLHFLREKTNLEGFDEDSISSYIQKSKCKISIEGKIYSHFDFIKYLLDNLPIKYRENLIKNIQCLNNLEDKYIDELMCKIPNEVCNDKHKKLISRYIKLRRDVLLSMVVDL